MGPNLYKEGRKRGSAAALLRWLLGSDREVFSGLGMLSRLSYVGMVLWWGSKEFGIWKLGSWEVGKLEVGGIGGCEDGRSSWDGILVLM